MLYSQQKERGNRFLLALKIGFPFLFLLSISLIFIFKEEILDKDAIILLSILAIVYTYFIFYEIYKGFSVSLIDPITNTFNYNTTVKEIKKAINQNETKNIVLISFSNIGDINQRYGLNFGNNILRNFVIILQDFFNQKNINKFPIGRYGGGYFLIVVKLNQAKLKHFLNTFRLKLLNNRIDNVEIKIEFSIVSSKYDKNFNNILLTLFEKLQDNTLIENNTKPDIYNKLAIKAVSEGRILLKFQPILNNMTNKIEIFSINPKIDIEEWGSLSISKAKLIIKRTNLELKYYFKLFEILCNKIKDFPNKSAIYLLKISATILRNNFFQMKILEILKNNNCPPENFILEFTDNILYDDVKRFNEILLSYKKEGFKLSLHNFGGNNASLEYIKYFSVDYINFDIEITKNIKNEKMKNILISYIKLAQLLKIKTIIRFIDKTEIYNITKEMEIDYLQGFVISKPKKIEDILKEDKND